MFGEEHSKGHKGIRLQNACDTCRRRKVKCDSAAMSDSICTNCTTSNRKCTHTLPDARKQGSSNELASWHRVRSLEKRAKKLEEALLAYAPNFDLDTHIGGSSNITRPQTGISRTLGNTASDSHLLSSMQRSLIGKTASDVRPCSEAELEKPQSPSMIKEGRFFGASSTYMYFQGAIDARKDYLDAEHPELEMPNFPPIHVLRKRGGYWQSPAYEIAADERQKVRSFDFPEEDLLSELVDIHFRTTACTMPIIHEPKFRKNVRRGLHHHDSSFGGLVMMMCALASRRSRDSRVFLPGQNEYSAGWKYYEQVPIMRQSLFQPPSLHELQTYCLAMQYAVGTSTPQSTWALLSLGLRICNELGIHRRRPPGYPITVEEEERKRIFWHLVGSDRAVSSFIGRPSEYRDEDFDADFPAECDDEYIVENIDGSVSFMQPVNKPSRLQYMSCAGRLQDILSVALRALYSTAKAQMQMGATGDTWERDVVSELDSALNRWLDTIPEHLRWDVAQTQLDETFFIQSLALHISYNIAQIQIHRPLLASSKSSEVGVSSVICANAARAIAGMVSSPRIEDLAVDSTVMTGSFMAAITLLMHMWRTKGQGEKSNVQRDLKDVEKCKAYLKLAEKRILCAGRFLDLLNELYFVQDTAVPPEVGHNGLIPSESGFGPSITTSNTFAISPSPSSWATSYLPQYGMRQDYPSIPVQVPFSLDHEPLGLEPDFPPAAEDQLFWQAPMGFGLSEWDEYIAKMTDELNQNQETALAL